MVLDRARVFLKNFGPLLILSGIMLMTWALNWWLLFDEVQLNAICSGANDIECTTAKTLRAVIRIIQFVSLPLFLFGWMRLFGDSNNKHSGKEIILWVMLAEVIIVASQLVFRWLLL